jgi:hypothetical protein
MAEAADRRLADKTERQRVSVRAIFDDLRDAGMGMRDPNYQVNDARGALYARLYNKLRRCTLFEERASEFDHPDLDLDYVLILTIAGRPEQ